MVELNDESRRNYNKDNQIRFENSMLRSNLCDYSDAYILVTFNLLPVAVANNAAGEAAAAAAAAAANNANKNVILKKMCFMY